MNAQVKYGIAVVSIVVLVLLIVFAWYPSQRRKRAERTFENAETAFRKGDSKRAIRLLDDVLESIPEHAKALLYRGQLSQEQDDPELAVEYWKRVPDGEASTASKARYFEGATLLELGLAREAESALIQSIKLNSNFDLPHQQLMLLYVVQMRRADVRKELYAIRTLRTFRPQELVWLVVDQLHAAPPSDRDQIKAFLKNDPEDVDSLTANIQYNRIHGRHNDSIETLESRLQNYPKNVRVRSLLADVYLDQNRLDDVHRLLKDITADEQSDPWLLRSFGRYLAASGHWEDAEKCLSRVVELDPFDEPSRFRLLSVLKRLKQTTDYEFHRARLQAIDQIVRDATDLISYETTENAPLNLQVDAMISIGDGLLRIDMPEDAFLFFEQAFMISRDNRAQTGLARAQQLGEQRNKKETSNDQNAEFKIALSDSMRSNGDSQVGEPKVSSSIQLRDVLEEVGLDFQYFNGDTGSKLIFETLGGGVSVFDFDADGWPDLYFPQGSKIPALTTPDTPREKLFRNRGDGTFEDVTKAAGLGEQRYGIGCIAADFDNNGYPDLYITAYGPNVFYFNNGDGTFNKATVKTGLLNDKLSSSATFADWDNDGDLDCYSVNYLGNPLKTCKTDTGAIGTCKPAHFPAEQDFCFTNNGDGTFTNSTQSAGIVVDDGKGLGVVAAHFDDDDQIDFYVANDTTTNFFFRNLGAGKFEEEGLISGSGANRDGMPEAGMGIACADLDGNGLMDLYVTNFYQQTNTMYLNQGGGMFVDATAASDTALATLKLLGFGTQPVDLDWDGHDELFVANGHIDDGVERTGKMWKMPPQLFRNLGLARFQDVSGEAGNYFRGKYLGRGVARLDWNRDGKVDILVVHQDRPIALLNNESETTGNSAVIELHGTAANRDAIGARIKIQAGEATKFLQICGGGGYLVTNESRQFVGLGQAERIDLIEIQWTTSESIERYEDLPVNAHLTFIEGGRHHVDSLKKH